jgi:hypothetical protein
MRIKLSGIVLSRYKTNMRIGISLITGANAAGMVGRHPLFSVWDIIYV